MKKIISIILAALVPAMLLTGCFNKPESEPPAGKEKEIVGGWKVNTGEITPQLSDEETDIFMSAIDIISKTKYEPVAVLGTQVVAGMNYAYLCRTTNHLTSWSVAVVYKDLKGRTQITSVRDIDLGDIRSISDKELFASKNLLGGYRVSEDISPVLLGTQIVSGTNYKTLYISDGKICVATVYEDLGGNKKTIEEQNLDLSYYISDNEKS